MAGERNEIGHGGAYRRAAGEVARGELAEWCGAGKTGQQEAVRRRRGLVRNVWRWQGGSEERTQRRRARRIGNAAAAMSAGALGDVAGERRGRAALGRVTEGQGGRWKSKPAAQSQTAVGKTGGSSLPSFPVG